MSFRIKAYNESVTLHVAERTVTLGLPPMAQYTLDEIETWEMLSHPTISRVEEIRVGTIGDVPMAVQIVFFEEETDR